MEPDATELTQLLNLAASGDSEASDQVVPRIYSELRQLAAWNISRLPSGETLQPTALVHEAWLRLAKKHRSEWEGRKMFFGAAAKAMRDILVEDARRKGAKKREGGRQRIDIEVADLAIQPPTEHMLDLDRALKRLEPLDPEGHRLVMLRFFAGLSMEETAELMEIPLRSCERKWRFVRSWLHGEMDLEL